MSFQTIYDWLKNLTTPKWLKELLGEIQEVIIAAMLQIGKTYVSGLVDQIITVADMDISNTSKFKKVFDWGKKNIPDIKDSTLNLAIECLVSMLKKTGFAKVS